MRGDERRIRDLGHIPEALLVEMREIDHDLAPVAGADQVTPEIGQPGTGVRTGRVAEGDAVAEDVRAAPDRPNRSKSATIQHIEHEKVRVDTFRAFDVQDGREGSVLDAGADVGSRRTDFDRTLRGAFDTEQQGRHMNRHLLAR